jgi:hypothetical protein
VTGTAGGIFAGLGFSFDDGSLLYDVNFPDVVAPQAPAQAALSYANGAGAAAIQAVGVGGRGSLVMFGFPFETITSFADRAVVIERVFDFFGVAGLPLLNADFNEDGIVNSADYTVWRNSLGQTTQPGERGDADFNGRVDVADFQIWKLQFGTTRDGGAATALAGAAGAKAAAPPVASGRVPAISVPPAQRDVRRPVPLAYIDENAAASRRPNLFERPVRMPGQSANSSMRQSQLKATELLLLTSSTGPCDERKVAPAECGKILQIRDDSTVRLDVRSPVDLRITLGKM